MIRASTSVLPSDVTACSRISPAAVRRASSASSNCCGDRTPVPNPDTPVTSEASSGSTTVTSSVRSAGASSPQPGLQGALGEL